MFISNIAFVYSSPLQSYRSTLKLKYDNFKSPPQSEITIRAFISRSRNMEQDWFEQITQGLDPDCFNKLQKNCIETQQQPQ